MVIVGTFANTRGAALRHQFLKAPRPVIVIRLGNSEANEMITPLMEDGQRRHICNTRRAALGHQFLKSKFMIALAIPTIQNLRKGQVALKPTAKASSAQTKTLFTLFLTYLEPQILFFYKSIQKTIEQTSHLMKRRYLRPWATPEELLNC